MRALLDTHSLLWFLLADSRLSGPALQFMVDAQNQLFVSPATPWEIAIKISIKKDSLPEPFETFFDRELNTNLISLLPITTQHLAAVSALPFHHRDPFDRLLIAQATVAAIPLISGGKEFAADSVTCIW